MDELDEVRALCQGLPGTTEALKAGGHPVWQVGGRTYCYFMDDHHGDGRLALWLKSTHDAQNEAVTAEPHRFFVPPYAGPQGWLGMRLDVEPDWDEVAGALEEAWRLQAPKRLQPGR